MLPFTGAGVKPHLTPVPLGCTRAPPAPPGRPGLASAAWPGGPGLKTVLRLSRGCGPVVVPGRDFHA